MGVQSSKRKSLRALDWVNIFLADIQGGVGPFLVIYLTSTLHWNPAQVGLAMTVAGLVGVVAQTPAGALIDQIHQKRSLFVGAALIVAIGSIATVASQSLPLITTAQALIAVAGAFFGPIIASISLGLVGRRGLDRRLGRNQGLSSIGNVVAALLAGLIGRFISQASIFYFMALMAVVLIITILQIRDRDIDYSLARGGDDGDQKVHVSHVMQLLGDRRLLILAVSAVLFHFANAAMLPH
jgi:MFS family permease